MPGAVSWSWPVCRTRLGDFVRRADTRIVVGFWLLGLINNVLYFVILSAAQDLVGSLPKGIVLLADVAPSFALKLVGPYLLQAVPYRVRVPFFIGLASTGMLIVALAPPSVAVGLRLAGVVMASLSSGGGELTFLSLVHFYGAGALASWGSGTGAAGLVGAGLYVALTEWWGFGIRDSLLVSACLPALMFVSFFLVLPQEPLRRPHGPKHDYEAVPGHEAADGDGRDADQAPRHVTLALPAPTPSARVHSAAPAGPLPLGANLRRARSLVRPYMIPLFLVYVAEYTINQGVAPTLLFPVSSSPFSHVREFYPFYGFLYQLGVFLSRSLVAFVRVRHLYLPSVLQLANLAVLSLQAVLYMIPSVYIVFAIVFWEGLLGGCVYVNCFAEILDTVPPEDREFSLGATSVSDSAGICTAGLVSIALETKLCDYQVAHGRKCCRMIGAGRS